MQEVILLNLLVLILLAIIVMLLIRLILKKDRSFSANKKTYIALPVVLIILAIGVFTPVGGFFDFIVSVSASLVLAPAALVALSVFIVLLLLFLFREKSRAFSKNRAYYLCIALAFVLLVADVVYLVTAPAAPLGHSAGPQPVRTEAVQALTEAGEDVQAL